MANRERDPDKSRESPSVVTWSAIAGRKISTGKAHQLLTDPEKYERIGHGVYRPLDLPVVDSDLVEIAVRAPRATLCLTSALAWHDLTDEIPMTHDVAIPRGAHAPALRAPTTFHRFDAGTYDVGREPHRVPGAEDLEIWVYSAERTIADLFRIPHRRDEAIAATRQWLRTRGNHPADLLKVGRRVPRAETAIRAALSVLT